MLEWALNTEPSVHNGLSALTWAVIGDKSQYVPLQVLTRGNMPPIEVSWPAEIRLMSHFSVQCGRVHRGYVPPVAISDVDKPEQATVDSGPSRKNQANRRSLAPALRRNESVRDSTSWLVRHCDGQTGTIRLPNPELRSARGDLRGGSTVTRAASV